MSIQQVIWSRCLGTGKSLRAPLKTILGDADGVLLLSRFISSFLAEISRNRHSRTKTKNKKEEKGEENIFLDLLCCGWKTCVHTPLANLVKWIWTYLDRRLKEGPKAFQAKKLLGSTSYSSGDGTAEARSWWSWPAGRPRFSVRSSRAKRKWPSAAAADSTAVVASPVTLYSIFQKSVADSGSSSSHQRPVERGSRTANTATIPTVSIHPVSQTVQIINYIFSSSISRYAGVVAVDSLKHTHVQK